MAFGFFKKTESADIIFYNGHIFTQDPDLPWADAAAVKGETIIGVGNFSEMENITGKATQLVDLEGKFMFPGFIDAHRSPVLKVFQDQYLDLSDCRSAEEILSAVSTWAEEHEEQEILFGYGYRDDLKPQEPNASADAEDDAEELEPADFPYSSKLLSQACEDKPVLLLCQNGVQCWTNMAADAIIAQTAEDEVVETITVAYVLNLLIPFDFDEIEDLVKFEIEALADAPLCIDTTSRSLLSTIGR